jgi:hypothetical protein
MRNFVYIANRISEEVATKAPAQNDDCAANASEDRNRQVIGEGLKEALAALLCIGPLCGRRLLKVISHD